MTQVLFMRLFKKDLPITPPFLFLSTKATFPEDNFTRIFEHSVASKPCTTAQIFDSVTLNSEIKSKRTLKGFPIFSYEYFALF